MKVKLLQDVLQSGAIKVSASRRRGAVAWFAGTVIEMSDASAQKFIDAGQAEPVADAAPAADEEPAQ